MISAISASERRAPKVQAGFGEHASPKPGIWFLPIVTIVSISTLLAVSAARSSVLLRATTLPPPAWHAAHFASKRTAPSAIAGRGDSADSVSASDAIAHRCASPGRGRVVEQLTALHAELLCARGESALHVVVA